jgi:hypothetical protein
LTETSWMGSRSASRPLAGEQPTANLADLLERILDKGIVIVGDIRVNLLDIELLTIRLRLLVASVDRAKEMGIDWWEHDPSLSSRAKQDETTEGASKQALEEENRRLRERLAAIEERTEEGGTAERRAVGDGAKKTAASSRSTRKPKNSD